MKRAPLAVLLLGALAAASLAVVLPLWAAFSDQPRPAPDKGEPAAG